jgi:hypothetical protein
MILSVSATRLHSVAALGARNDYVISSLPSHTLFIRPITLLALFIHPVVI